MVLLSVLIERKIESLNRPFSYAYHGEKTVDVGYRVLINFNNSKIVGYVIKKEEINKTHDELEKDLGFKISEILDVIDEKPLLNEELMNLANTVANYYLAPLISVLQAMLPPSLKPSSSALKGPKIAYDQYVKVINEDETNLTAKQIVLLRSLKENEQTLKRDIKQAAVLNNLIKLGRVEVFQVEKRRLKMEQYEIEEPKELTLEQKEAIKNILATDKTVTLLEGVTGSGKTEVYLELIEHALNEGKSALMLVPEIALTPLMMERILRRFPSKVAIIHSELTPAEKYDEYRNILNGTSKLVVGTRSAIFAPLTNIGYIILDEEHVESYKQDNLPFYNAKDVAIIRANYHHAKVVLGSATPSLEVKARADKGNYNLVKLTKRVNEKELPKTIIVDISKAYNLTRESSIFSKTLINQLEGVLERKEQAILLINRRGFSGFVTCRSCGHLFKCPNCDIPYTYHKKDNILKCHNCGHLEFAPETCPECGSKYLSKRGFGTERIVDEVNRIFPTARVLRLDSDVSEVRNNIAKTLTKFANQEADILVGTQMIAKGHDFPNVTLAAIVLADIGLSIPSYRANEVTFQLITQAIGRSGRSDKEGTAIIQTYNPYHYAIQFAARQDYEGFYKKEIQFRKAQQYPPFTYLATIEISSKAEEKLEDVIRNVAVNLRNENMENVTVLGPIAPYIYQENGTYHRLILVKYKNSDKIKAYLANLLETFKVDNKLSIRININPYNF